MGDRSKTRHKLKSLENSFAPNWFINCPTVLRLCTACVICTNFHNDWAIQGDVIDERNFARFEFEESFGRASVITAAPWVGFVCEGDLRNRDANRPTAYSSSLTLQWRHNERDGVSNHQPHDCLLNRLFRRRSQKTSKFRVTCLCAGSSPVTDEFPAQKASNTENVSIWWILHGKFCLQRRLTEPRCQQCQQTDWHWHIQSGLLKVLFEMVKWNNRSNTFGVLDVLSD